MNGTKKNKLTVVISSLMAGVFLMTSCSSVNVNGIGEAFTNLGSNLREAARTSSRTTRETSPEPEETVVIEVTPAAEETVREDVAVVAANTATPTPTSTPAPTATPIPSPTPAPQRVDFSDLTEDTLADRIVVESEDFIETAHAEDDDDVVLAEFIGNRMLLTSEDDAAPVMPVNLMLDAFYMEAEGIYNRVVNEQYAYYDLDPETVPDTVTVSVSYDYYFNGRLLNVVMDYQVTSGEEVITEQTEYDKYDLYTGQLINDQMLLENVDEFYDALAAAIADSTTDTRDEAEDYEIQFFAVETDDDGEQTITAVVINDGVMEVYNVEFPDLYEFLNRYGRLILNVSAPVIEEEAEEEDDEVESEDEDTRDSRSDEEDAVDENTNDSIFGRTGRDEVVEEDEDTRDDRSGEEEDEDSEDRSERSSDEDEDEDDH